MNPFEKTGGAVRRHPRISILSLAVVLAAAGVGGYLAADASGSTPATTTSASTTTNYTVATGTIKQSVSSSGTLAPADDDDLSFTSSGVVTSVLVTEGQTVKKGQKLATIDSATLKATVAQDKASVTNDEAKVDTDQTDVDDDVDGADTQLAVDKAALTAAKNQLATDETALAGATLVAPISGVVASVNYTVGESVSGSSSGGTGGSDTGGDTSSSTSSTGIEVISTNSWVVNATVDATSVDLIKAGDQAELTVTGSTDTVYGTVASVAVLSSSTGTTASYPVVIDVTGSPTGLHDGAAVTATLIYQQLSNVIVVPSGALHRNTDGSEYVEKVVDGKTTEQTVKVGTTSGTETEITSGLSAGDVILVQQFRPTGTGSGTTSTNGSTTTGSTGGGTVGGGTDGGGFGGPPGGGAPGGGGFGG